MRARRRLGRADVEALLVRHYDPAYTPRHRSSTIRACARAASSSSRDASDERFRARSRDECLRRSGVHFMRRSRRRRRLPRSCTRRAFRHHSQSNRRRERSRRMLDKPAPDFELPATGGKNFRLAAAKGKPSSSTSTPKTTRRAAPPKASSSATSTRNSRSADCDVYGISRDSLKSHENFKAKMSFPFDLLSDAEENACKAFDVIKMKNMYGKKVRGIERSTFVIDGDGVRAPRVARREGAGPCAGGARIRQDPARSVTVVSFMGSVALTPLDTEARVMTQRKSASDVARFPRRHQALRARHQRADARSHEPLPVRGARRLHPDGDARGARQPQEGHVGSRAQRAAGEPLSRRDRQRARRRASPKASRSSVTATSSATGRLFLQTEAIDGELPARLADAARPTTRSSASSCTCRRRTPKREVILVSKDINMRIKARALGLAAEDYFNDKVLEDTDLLYTGTRELPADFWDQHGKDMESWQQGGHTYYRMRGPLCSRLHRERVRLSRGRDSRSTRR